jgi:hypothetical protein
VATVAEFAVNWQRKLSHPVPYIKPRRGELRTLADARAYALKREPDSR